MKLTLNGKTVEAEKGEYLLAVARRENIRIPSLCHHDGVEPVGACRLCVVEITRPEWGGWTRLVTSCLYQAEEGLIVDTHSPKVVETRATLLDMQLARCPNSDVIKGWAKEYGIEKTTMEIRVDGDNCILCDICVRVCEAVGRNAIARTSRGIQKVIATPLELDEERSCIGCLACAHACPTDAIPWEEKDGKRTIWDHTFDLVKCVDTGDVLGTPEQLKHFAQKSGLPEAYFTKSDRARKLETARKFVSVV
ncbi:MAG: 2Fe-2S iron-sulfur cluster-binding protein [bacterium]|nr:2Fe-2S iron-sulfur cluster-binding protein [bacterium]